MTELNKRFKACSLDNFKCESREQQEMINYFKNCLEKGFNENVILIGGVGLGKTHIAYSLINSLEKIKKSEYSKASFEYYTNEKAELTTIKGIIDAIRACWHKDADEIDRNTVKRVKSIGLLIVDEVGVQYGTDSERLELFDIFNYRYNEMLPTMILSNLNREQIDRTLGQRISDRLFGGAKIFELKGQSKR